MSIMSEEQKIIDLENEIRFLKDVLCEKQKEIEEKSTIIMAGAEKVKQLEKEIEDMREELQMYVDIGNNNLHNYISKDKIREKIKEVQETMCPMCCACGLCDEINELLEEN